LSAAGNTAPTAARRSVASYGSNPLMPVVPVQPITQTLATAQQQELLYRELLSRAPYISDPALTQQVKTSAKE